jgi:23S rRNA (guanosine2251-2'-O)-methyltransferase
MKLLHGFHAVGARLRNAPASIQALFADRERDDPRMRALLQEAEAQGVRVLSATATRLDGMVRGGRHQGVVAEVDDTPTRWGSLEDLLDGLHEPAFLVLLDGVQDPHNLGAILRSADGAGAHAVIVPRDRAAGVSASVARVSAGASESMPFFAVPNLAREMRALKDRGIWLVGLADEAERVYHQCDLRRSMALVMGAEGSGLRRLTREHCDELVRIPMRGAVESLNVSVATAVCLYEARRQRDL